MLAKCSVFIATSLDGFIARPDGAIDWLMEANSLAPPGEDCGYKSVILRMLDFTSKAQRSRNLLQTDCH